MSERLQKVKDEWNQISESDWYMSYRKDEVIQEIIKNPKSVFHRKTMFTRKQTIRLFCFYYSEERKHDYSDRRKFTYRKNEPVTEIDGKIRVSVCVYRPYQNGADSERLHRYFRV